MYFASNIKLCDQWFSRYKAVELHGHIDIPSCYKIRGICPKHLVSEDGQVRWSGLCAESGTTVIIS